MEFTYQDKGNNHGALEYEQDGERVAELWVLKDGVMNMDQGCIRCFKRTRVAKKLLDAAADYARENNFKMNAICSMSFLHSKK